MSETLYEGEVSKNFKVYGFHSRCNLVAVVDNCACRQDKIYLECKKGPYKVLCWQCKRELHLR
jgi:hypothetical protein